MEIANSIGFGKKLIKSNCSVGMDGNLEFDEKGGICVMGKHPKIPNDIAGKSSEENERH